MRGKQAGDAPPPQEPLNKQVGACCSRKAGARTAPVLDRFHRCHEPALAASSTALSIPHTPRTRVSSASTSSARKAQMASVSASADSCPRRVSPRSTLTMWTRDCNSMRSSLGCSPSRDQGITRYHSTLSPRGEPTETSKEDPRSIGTEALFGQPQAREDDDAQGPLYPKPRRRSSSHTAISSVSDLLLCSPRSRETDHHNNKQKYRKLYLFCLLPLPFFQPFLFFSYRLDIKRCNTVD